MPQLSPVQGIKRLVEATTQSGHFNGLPAATAAVMQGLLPVKLSLNDTNIITSSKISVTSDNVTYQYWDKSDGEPIIFYDSYFENTNSKLSFILQWNENDPGALLELSFTR